MGFFKAGRCGNVAIKSHVSFNTLEVFTQPQAGAHDMQTYAQDQLYPSTLQLGLDTQNSTLLRDTIRVPKQSNFVRLYDL